MGATVGDALVQRLSEWDVELVFGCPADGINGIRATLERRDSDAERWAVAA